jgi:hypothetical protein
LREKTHEDAITGYEAYILTGIPVAIVFYFFPGIYRYVGSFLTFVLAQYLWHIGFFKRNKYRSRKDQETADRIKFVKARLEREKVEEQIRKVEERKRKMAEGRYPDGNQFP